VRLAAVASFVAILAGPLRAASVEERHRRAAEGIRLPAEETLEQWRRRDRWHREALDILTDRMNWERGLAEIEDRLGLFRESLDIRITLEEGPGGSGAAEGGGRNGCGIIRFHMSTLSDYMRILREHERRARNPRAIVIVPPMHVDRMIWHELTHVFQNDRDLPDWFREGMACYVEQNDAHLRGYVSRGEPMDNLDAEWSRDRSYARGWLFWRWLEAEHGREAVHELVRRTIEDGEGWRTAIEATTHLSWSEVVQREFAWSRAWYDRERADLDRLRRQARGGE
jgi:hypothetical protein